MHKQTMQIYMDDRGYDRLLDRLVAVAKVYDPASPSDLRTDIIEVLGDLGGLWPASCLDSRAA